MSSLALHWHEWGEGNRMALLLHGIATDATSWEGLAPLLAARGYRVLAPDLRGHGLSPGARNYDLNEFAGDVLRRVVDLPLELCIGHSMGGAILGLLNEKISATKAIYVDPAWDVTQDRPETDASTFVSMARWGDAELLAAHPQ